MSYLHYASLQKTGGAVSENILEDNTGHILYTMIITENREDPTDPEQRHIGFATNDDAINARVCCTMGTDGYGLTEPMRPKTRIGTMTARMSCFYYVLIVCDLLVILRMESCKLSQHDTVEI